MLEFETTYHQYFRFVWASARRLGVGEEDIDDVVQEVFLVIHAKLDTVRDPDALRSWIYGVVRRTVSTQRRQAKTRAARVSILPDAEAVPSPGPTPAEASEHSADAVLLQRILATLSDAKREVFVLAELEELSAAEIAAALEIPLNTVYSRLRHARQDFEAALGRHRASLGNRGPA